MAVPRFSYSPPFRPMINDSRTMKAEVGEYHFRDILDRLPEAVVLLDRQGRIRYVNPTASRVVENTPLEIDGILRTLERLTAELDRLDEIQIPADPARARGR